MSEYNPALSPCPICGGSAYVMHVYDTYDRADYGWDAGCSRFSLYDGIHDLNKKSPSVQFPRVSGYLTSVERKSKANDGGYAT